MTHDTSSIAGRRRALCERLPEKAILLYNYEGSDRASLRYLTGFTGEGALVVSDAETVLITDSRYTEQARRETSGVRIEESRDWMGAGSAAVLRGLGIDRVAFSSKRVTHHWYDAAVKLDGLTWVPMPDPVNELRAVKSPAEIECLRKAARLADDALSRLVPEIQLGMDEMQVALRLEWLMREAGSEGIAFDVNVSAGENSALNHYNPAHGRRKLRRGDLLLFDFGACVDGYRSDITRTLSLGTPSNEAKTIYSTVLRANLAGIDAARPGATGVEVDAAAREVIRKAGYGERFGHGLGHGIGLEVHERPGLSPLSKDTLAVGMVTTIEPGIYLPGVGGVRIEDDVVIVEGGCEVITGFPKDRLIQAGA
ncbi:MAG: Xaa-Pro peptidase family protein [Candidatus Bipolaricaulis sp.]|nr:Xaa-Pro peptidase family protein [Candidatus Bipolaricaulis sp.]